MRFMNTLYPLACALLLCSTATAGDEPTADAPAEGTKVASARVDGELPPEAARPEQPAPDAAEDAPNNGSVSASIGSEFVNKYYFRGIIQETEGFVAQPSMEVGIALIEGAGPLDDLSLTVGTWNSLHTGPSGSGGTNSDPGSWYEADIYGGLSLTLFEMVSLGATYTAYTSPNGAFSTVHEIAPSLGFDDSGLWPESPFGGIQPAVTVAVELQGQADGGAEGGVYAEVGASPSVTLYESTPVTFTLAAPLTVGLSAKDYYEDAGGEDSVFGYFQGGLVLDTGLGFIPARVGALSVVAGAKLLVLGQNTKLYNNGEGQVFLGFGGLSLSY